MKTEEEILKSLDKEINPYSLSVLKSYAKEHAIDFLVDLAEHYVQNTHSREKAESYYNYWTTNKPQP